MLDGVGQYYLVVLATSSDLQHDLLVLLVRRTDSMDLN